MRVETRRKKFRRVGLGHSVSGMNVEALVGVSYLDGNSSHPSIEARRKEFVTRTVAMIISSSFGGERSIWRSNTTPALKGPPMLLVRYLTTFGGRGAWCEDVLDSDRAVESDIERCGGGGCWAGHS